jgi:GAF domain-containing protein
VIKSFKSFITSRYFISGIFFTLLCGGLLFLTQYHGISQNISSVAAILSGITAMAALTAYQRAWSSRSQELKQEISMLLYLIHRMLRLNESHHLRATLFRVNYNYRPPRLEAIARRTSEGEEISRASMMIHQGIAGRVYREGHFFIISIPDNEDFVLNSLKWGFTKEESLNFRSDRRSFLCAPILGTNGDVIAVLCLDAKTPDVFKTEHTEILEIFLPLFAAILTGSERGQIEKLYSESTKRLSA